MKKNAFSYRKSYHRPFGRQSRTGGLVAVYTALGAIVFLGIAALVVDLGFRYWRHAESQKATDAAALAGAWYIPDHLSASGARSWAKYYAAQNGFTDGTNNTVVTTEYPAAGNAAHFKVTVSSRVPLFFAGVLGIRSNNIITSAVAELRQNVEFDINGNGAYGALGPVNLSLFGPDGYYEFGDSYSTKKMWVGSPGSAARQDNPNYKPNGYDFVLKVPAGYKAKYGSILQLGIYDPDCWNPDGSINAGGPTKVDEMRTPTGGEATGYPTTTRYQLVYETKVDGKTVRTVIGQNSWGADSSTNAKWVQDAALKVNLDTYDLTKGRLLVNVQTTAGASENGFDLRAGPPHAADMTETDWINQYGNKPEISTIAADGPMPMNFNTSGTVTVTLGQVPAYAAGGTLNITKFDTDVGSKSVIYEYLPTGLDPNTASNWIKPTVTGQSTLGQGVLSNNAQFATDRVNLPSNYAGGTWRATYQAGLGDTSVWNMNVAGGRPSEVWLVK